ncbi:MAG: hypothetical protein HY958_00640, partial [Bacteroidia bacterium]|nr:hypothetical protein [Bacteroidia bacterium]
FQETDKKIDRLAKISQESDKKIDKLAKMYGGISKNLGDAAEDFFYNGLSATYKIGNIKYDYVDRNSKRKHKKYESEFDALLINSDSVVIVEIKYKLHPDEVEKLIKNKIPLFKKLYPEYKGYKVYGAIAGFAIHDETKNLAKKHGLFILTQSGEAVKVINEAGFKPKEY